MVWLFIHQSEVETRNDHSIRWQTHNIYMLSAHLKPITHMIPVYQTHLMIHKNVYKKSSWIKIWNLL